MHTSLLLVHLIREKLCTTQIPDNAKEVEILEVDKLFTYYQKTKEPMYGFLFTETRIILLISR